MLRKLRGQSHRFTHMEGDFKGAGDTVVLRAGCKIDNGGFRVVRSYYSDDSKMCLQRGGCWASPELQITCLTPPARMKSTKLDSDTISGFRIIKRRKGAGK